MIRRKCRGVRRIRRGIRPDIEPHGPIARWLLPRGVDPEALLLLAARALRAIGDGYMAVLLPAYLLAIGLDTLQVGIVSTATMLGSALTTLAVGAWGHLFAGNRLLRAAATRILFRRMGFCCCWKPLISLFFRQSISKIEAIHGDGSSCERWVGLKNLGNTCFINSGRSLSAVMQALLANEPLLQRLRSKDYQEKAKTGAFCQRILSLHE